jgi:general secretion pathway protein A
MPTKRPERRLMLKRLGFSEDPFMASADPRFLYLSSQHGEVLERARDVIEEFRGLAVVEGSYGVGKSSLALRLESLYRGQQDDYQVVFIHTSSYESEFAGLQDMCEFIGIPHKRGLTKQWRAFEDFLVTQHQQGRNVVIILDDAQLMAPDALRIVHTLYNFDAGGHKLAQVILFGQPELSYVFAMHPEIRSRVSSWFRLNPLSVEDTVELIRFRCKVAGRDDPLVTQAGYLAIYEASQGTPRAIVSLCARLLEEIAQNGERTASAESVEAAIRDWRQSYTGPLASDQPAARVPATRPARSRPKAGSPKPARKTPRSAGPSRPSTKAGKRVRSIRS